MDQATADVSLALQLAQEGLGEGGIGDEAGWFAVQAALAEELSAVHDRELALRFGAGHHDSAFGRHHDLQYDIPQPNVVLFKQCTSCGDPSPASGTLDAPCTHSYCKDCVVHLFTASTSDESLFPASVLWATYPAGPSQDVSVC